MLLANSTWYINQGSYQPWFLDSPVYCAVESECRLRMFMCSVGFLSRPIFQGQDNFKCYFEVNFIRNMEP